MDNVATLDKLFEEKGGKWFKNNTVNHFEGRYEQWAIRPSEAMTEVFIDDEELEEGYGNIEENCMTELLELGIIFLEENNIVDEDGYMGEMLADYMFGYVDINPLTDIIDDYREDDSIVLSEKLKHNQR